MCKIRVYICYGSGNLHSIKLYIDGILHSQSTYRTTKYLTNELLRSLSIQEIISILRGTLENHTDKCEVKRIPYDSSNWKIYFVFSLAVETKYENQIRALKSHLSYYINEDIVLIPEIGKIEEVISKIESNLC